MTRTMVLAILLAAAAAPAQAQVASCLGAHAAQADGVTVEALAEREGDYRVLRVAARNGATLLIYHDAQSEAVARSRAGCLGIQLNILQADLLDDRQGAEWHSVVFTADRAYVPPRDPGRPVRWVVHTATAGPDEPNIDSMVLTVIPHEQVHGFQLRNRAVAPRWFAEGHATWTGLRVTSQLDPARGAADRAKAVADRATATGPLALAAWGSVRPRREAILRQVSPEDRARMEADPTYMPAGPFRFTTADLEGDESNMLARYSGALAVFDTLEARHGADRVRNWAREVTATAGRVSHEALVESVRRHFDEDLDALLATQD